VCVAILKPAGIKVPSKEIFEASFSSNPDGAGIGFPVSKEDGSKKIRIVKGLQTFKEFWEKFEELNSTYNFENLPLLLHFRIGTHGSKASPAHTHPFPVVESYTEMCELETECDFAALHNGIFRFTGGNDSFYTSRSYSTWDYETGAYVKKLDAESPSDTMEFIKRLVYPLIQEPDFFLRDNLLNMLSDLVGTNRLILLNAEGANARFGAFIEHEGVFYSNESFRPKAKIRTKPQTDIQLTNTSKFKSYYEMKAAIKETVAQTLQSEMIKFLVDKTQSLSLFYDKSIKSFEEALKACDLQDFWPAGQRKSYDRLYADCIQYNPIFEPECAVEYPDSTLVSEPESFFFDTRPRFGVKSSSQYLLYRLVFVWEPKEHCFNFWGVSRYDYFAAGFYEGLKKKPYFRISRWKYYTEVMFPSLSDSDNDLKPLEKSNKQKDLPSLSKPLHGVERSF